ncbi:MAG: FlgD immunoglobulin-like domain containing protein [bacterium]
MMRAVTLWICLAAAAASPTAYADDWAAESIAPFSAYFDMAVDGDGIPHVLFNNCQAWELCVPADPGNSALTYGFKTGAEWSFEPVASDPVGEHFSIIVDNTNMPHLAYRDTTWQMHYGYRDAGGWVIEDLYHERLLRYRASPHLALDSNGEPHIAFVERETIHYAYKENEVWTDEQVTGSSLDNWSARAAIAVDDSDALYVGSWMYDQSAVLYTRGTASWTHDLDGGDIGWNPWMVLDSHQAAHFVYHGYNGVSYATNAGGSWVEELIDPTGQNGADDISLDTSGRPVVVYVTAALVSYDPILYDAELRLARRDGDAWVTEPIATAQSVEDWTMNPRMEVDGLDRIHVLYHDPVTGELRYATRSLPTAVPDPSPRVDPPALSIAPNPFSRTADIVFELRSAERAELVVYDVCGRLVRILAATGMPAGEHHISWDGMTESGTRVPSGVYFIRLKTATGTSVRRAVLMK